MSLLIRFIAIALVLLGFGSAVVALPACSGAEVSSAAIEVTPSPVASSGGPARVGGVAVRVEIVTPEARAREPRTAPESKDAGADELGDDAGDR